MWLAARFFDFHQTTHQSNIGVPAYPKSRVNLYISIKAIYSTGTSTTHIWVPILDLESINFDLWGIDLKEDSPYLKQYLLNCRYYKSMLTDNKMNVPNNHSLPTQNWCPQIIIDRTLQTAFERKVLRQCSKWANMIMTRSWKSIGILQVLAVT